MIKELEAIRASLEARMQSHVVAAGKSLGEEADAHYQQEAILFRQIEILDALMPAQRLQNDSRKIDQADTGLAAAFYVHVARDAAGHVRGVRFSAPGKAEKTKIERILAAINAALAELLADDVTGPLESIDGEAGR